VQGQETDKDRQTHIKRRRKQVNIPRQYLPCQPPLALPQLGIYSQEKGEKGKFASSLRTFIPSKKFKERRQAPRSEPHLIQSHLFLATGGFRYSQHSSQILHQPPSHLKKPETTDKIILTQEFPSLGKDQCKSCAANTPGLEALPSEAEARLSHYPAY
jgi:hypothetical protein